MKLPIPESLGSKGETGKVASLMGNPFKLDPEIYLDRMIDKYFIQEPSMYEKIQRQENLPSSVLYDIPFTSIPGQPGRYIPQYEKVDYPDAPLEIHPSKRVKNTKIKRRPVRQTRKKIKYAKYIPNKKAILI